MVYAYPCALVHRHQREEFVDGVMIFPSAFFAPARSRPEKRYSADLTMFGDPPRRGADVDHTHQ